MEATMMIGNTEEYPKSWKSVKTVEHAKYLVDVGTILSWDEVKNIRKALNVEDLSLLLRHFAVRFSERLDDRLSEEILLESLLNLMTNTSEEEVLNSFLDELFRQGDLHKNCKVIVEMVLIPELTDNSHYEEIFAFGVAFVCELGFVVKSGIELGAFDENDPKINKLLDHISTYLLSVSNNNNNCIRLSLVTYFASYEKGKRNKPGFNRILGRFGHTILDHLFTLLFNKKTEGLSLQYLLDTLPAMLEADNHVQKILHETFKLYMLKKPERFSLFLQTLTLKLIELPREETRISNIVFLQHLGMLLKIVSEVNHKDLTREIMGAIALFKEEEYRQTLIGLLLRDNSIRPYIRSVLSRVSEADDVEKLLEEDDSFKSSKRGRKPSFAKSESYNVIQKVTILGKTVARAS